MLSYQHIYHAGNLADVQKHTLLAFALDYMTRKNKPLTYIETHAGRGVYDLTAPEATKTGESSAGVSFLEQNFPADHPYRRRLTEARALFGNTAYPGSPLIAALSLRNSDSIHLAELHPQEHMALVTNMGRWGLNIAKRDGLEMVLALTPPTPRRGLILIDPSYELKSDYIIIPSTIEKISRKWNVGIIILWYPILIDAPHTPMLRTLMTNHPKSFHHELRFPPVRNGHKMIGTGMWILNAPYGIEAEAQRLNALYKKL